MIKSKWQYIKSFCRTHWLRLGGTIFCGIIANFLIILIPVSLGKYFDLLFGFQSHRAAFLDTLPFSFWDSINQYLIFLGVLVIGRMIFQFLQRYQTGVLGEYFVRDLRERLFERQLRIETSVYDDRGTGRYLLRHSGDLKSIQNYFTKGIIRFGTDGLLIVFALSVLFWINQTIFLIIAFGFILTTGIIYLLNKVLFHISEKRRNIRSGLLAYVSRQLRATKTIKAFNKMPTELGKYDKRSTNLFQIGLKFQTIYHFIFSSIPTLLYLTLIGVLYYIYHAKEQNIIALDTAGLLGFIFLFITILPIFRRVIRVNTVWELGNISFDKFLDVFQLPIEKRIKSGQSYRFEGGYIQVKNISFSYNSDFPVFQNTNFKILPQQVNQIRIGNGEGKSTLVKLLAGLYHPQKGKILYDGQNIRQLNLKSIRRKVTFISDEFPLLGRSVFEVISYSRNEEKQVYAQQVLDLFQIDIPRNLRLNVGDKITEGSENLAKSQVKMLQYARAALSEKPIIIIDEPLRNLERKTKQNILNWLQMQVNKKTIVLLSRNWKNSDLPISNCIQFNQNKHEFTS